MRVTERTGQPSPKAKPSAAVPSAIAVHGEGLAPMRPLRPTLVSNNVRTGSESTTPAGARTVAPKSSPLERAPIKTTSTFKIVSPLALPSAESPIDGPIPDDDAYRAATAGALRQRQPPPEPAKASVSHRVAAAFDDAVDVRAHRSKVPCADAAQHEAAIQARAHRNERMSKVREAEDKPSPLWRIVTLSSDAVVLTFALPYMALWHAARALRRLMRPG